jgi:hypothetical protein
MVPLLGPPTSIGDVHHGAWYYYLLSPAAAVTAGDSPLAVVALIALAGIAAVGVVWWFARAIGGPVAGAVAGLAMALSAAAIDESTFIWNPNLIALSSALALAGTWRAWTGGDRRWWLLAAFGTALTMQCHVLGVALLPIVVVPLVADARRRPLGPVILGCLAILAAAYLPLVVNELTTGGSELRAALDYLAGGRAGAETPIPVRFGIVGLRVLSWPLTGLITDGFVIIRDWRPTAIALRHPDGREIDLHPVRLTADGGGDQVQLDGVTTWHYDVPVEGSIDGRPVPCCSVETQIEAHRGYEPDDDDRHDMALLQAAFDVELPTPYRSTERPRRRR